MFSNHVPYKLGYKLSRKGIHPLHTKIRFRIFVARISVRLRVRTFTYACVCAAHSVFLSGCTRLYMRWSRNAGGLIDAHCRTPTQFSRATAVRYTSARSRARTRRYNRVSVSSRSRSADDPRSCASFSAVQ